MVENGNIVVFGSQESVQAYSSDYLRESEAYVINFFARLGSRILDLGCGTGRTTVYIKKSGAEVVGVDPAEGMIKKGKEMHPELDLRLGDARKLDFPENYFDLVFFSFNGIDNLYPIYEREMAVAEIRRVLKSGGVFAYSSHNSLALPHTKRGLKDFVRNLPKLRFSQHWRVERHNFGQLYQYYNNVWNEERMINQTGFNLIKRIGHAFFERFPMYIAKKL
ncbi:MAG TPA: class I SAM-dependent methyltransferase [Candidatus Paceibacterota bacterium]